jgi:hypothetical protein
VSLLELGLAFREFLTLSFTARGAARVGSLAGNCRIIEAASAALNAVVGNPVKALWIYESVEQRRQPGLARGQGHRRPRVEDRFPLVERISGMGGGRSLPSRAGRGQRLTGKENRLVEMPGPRAS